jgi:hypothetical protein
MRLLRLKRAKWDVLVVLEREREKDVCPVLDFLLNPREGQQAARRAFYAFLRESVPMYGPQEENTELCFRMRPYEDGLFEFRKQPRHGPKLRVLFFRDGKRIICVDGFLKTNETPQRKLTEAAAVRRRYFEAKAKKDAITIAELEES